ncbi:ribonuclease H-like domain-containing protein [Tanacetum coccineum]
MWSCFVRAEVSVCLKSPPSIIVLPPNKVHSSFKLSGILNQEYIVLPAGNSYEAIPEDATTKMIFPQNVKHIVMDPNSRLGKIYLGENVVEILSDKVEGSGDWNSLEFQDTANSGQKKETKAMVFHQMDTKEVSDRFVAPCFVNGLEAYDGEINLGVEENMISNEYVVKLCLEHEVKRGNKVVKKELIVALRGEIYFVKFFINPEEDDVEPGVILGRSFLRMTKAIIDFEAGTVTIYPEFDPFLEDIEEEEKSLDDWDHLLDFNLDDIPLLGEEELPPFVCKMGKRNRNKKRSMKNLSLFYQDIGTSSSVGGHLTQEEEAKKALAIRISQKFALLKEVRPVIETMAYHDKYKKVLDENWKDKVELDGKIVKEEEEVIKRIKGEALKEKDDPGAFIFPIRLEGKVGVTTIIAKFLILDIPIVVGRGFLYTISSILNTPEKLFSTFDGICHQTFRAARFDVLRTAESRDDEEEYQIKRNKFGAPIYVPKPAPYFNCNNPAERSLALQAVINPFRKISVWKKAVSFLGSLPVPLKQVNLNIIMSSWTSCLAPTLPIYTDLSRDGQSLLGANDVEGYRREGISLAFIVLGPEDPQTPPVPQDEEEREPMFVQAHNHRYSARTYIPEYIPLEDMDMSLVGSRQEDPDRSATRMMRQRMVRLTDPVVTGGDVVPPPYQLTIILGTRITGSECNLLAVHGPTCTFIHLLTTIILGDPTQIQTSVIASHSRLLLMPSLPALPSPSIYNISIHTSTCDRRDDVLSYPEQPPPRQYGWWKGGCTYMPFYSERIGLTRPRIDSSDALGASGPIADDLVFASGPELDQRLSRRLDETDRRRQDQMVETLRVIRDMRNESYEQTCQTELLALTRAEWRAPR